MFHNHVSSGGQGLGLGQGLSLSHSKFRGRAGVKVTAGVKLRQL